MDFIGIYIVEHLWTLIHCLFSGPNTQCRTISKLTKWPQIPLLPNIIKNERKNRLAVENARKTFPDSYRIVYPEFLPDPALERRNPIRERLERVDMLRRRANIYIPEFYTGKFSIIFYSSPSPDNMQLYY